MCFGHRYLPFEHAMVTNPMALKHHTIVFPGHSLLALDAFLLVRALCSVAHSVSLLLLLRECP